MAGCERSQVVVPAAMTQGTLGEEVELEQAPPATQRRAFMQLALEERRRILAEQAEEMVAHYEKEAEWRELGGGDLAEY